MQHHTFQFEQPRCVKGRHKISQINLPCIFKAKRICVMGLSQFERADQTVIRHRAFFWSTHSTTLTQSHFCAHV